jgi:hypothetical protein
MYGIEDESAYIVPREPLMIRECDGKTVFSTHIQPKMENQSETVMVSDGAGCSITIKNTTSNDRGIYYVNYTILHEIDNSSSIVAVEGDSYITNRMSFQRIPNCYIDKLSPYLNVATIYETNEPSNLAVHWLMNDTSVFSTCEYDTFIERYALATISFNNPFIEIDETSGEAVVFDDESWIEKSFHCTWSNIACVDGRVTELDLTFNGLGYRSITGPIPTEIGLLRNLITLQMSWQNSAQLHFDDSFLSLSLTYGSNTDGNWAVTESDNAANELAKIRSIAF